MKKYERPFDPNALREFKDRYDVEVDGTISIPPPYPQFLADVGANPRNDKTNSFRGTTITHPDPDTLVIATSWDDWNDHARTDEDVNAFTWSTRTWRPWPKGRYEKENPLYAGTHRGSKNHFPQVTRPPNF